MAITIKSAISSVKWEKFGEHMTKIYSGIYDNVQYTDCRLILSNGEQRASRIVLGMASTFFENIFAATYSQQVAATDPLVILIPDVTVTSMRQVLELIYTGELRLCPGDMPAFLDACCLLQIRGMKGNDGRILEAYISDSNSAVYGASQKVDTNFACGPTAYVMSVVTADDDDDDDGGAAEAEQEQTFESSYEPIVLQNDVVKETTQVTIPTSKSPAAVEQSGTQYYDIIEEQKISEQQEEAEEGDTDDINLDTLMVGELDGMNCFNDDTAPSEKEEPLPEAPRGSYSERLEQAVNAVANEGVSFRTASVTYNIPKTVLWRKTMKVSGPTPKHVHELPSPRRAALEAIKAGEKLMNVSRRFDIPLSTLHRDKIRLYSEGQLPETVALKQRDKGEPFKQRIMDAAQQCAAGTMSISEAARLYALPKTTIWRKIGMLKAKTDSGSGSGGGGSFKRTRGRRKLNSKRNEQESTAEDWKEYESTVVTGTAVSGRESNVDTTSSYVYM